MVRDTAVFINMLDNLLLVEVSMIHPESGRFLQFGQGTNLLRTHHAEDGTPGWTFTPYSIEALAAEVASTGAWERDVFLMCTMNANFLSLVRARCRENAKNVVGCLIRGTGQQFQSGDDIPALDT